jgi:hypothetical protein
VAFVRLSSETPLGRQNQLDGLQRNSPATGLGKESEWKLDLSKGSSGRNLVLP